MNLEVDACGIAQYSRNAACRKGEVYTFCPPEEAQAQICVEFLSRCVRTKTGRCDSYWLKHVIERWASPAYVSNGACIEAAKRLGVAHTEQDNSPNCLVGVSFRSVNKTSATLQQKRIN